MYTLIGLIGAAVILGRCISNMKLTIEIDSAKELSDLLDILRPDTKLTALAGSLHSSSETLEAAVNASKGQVTFTQGMVPMNPLDTLTAEITKANTVISSAVTLINGIKAQQDAAVQQALANGATAAQLQPIIALGTNLSTNADALSAAVAASTPAPAP